MTTKTLSDVKRIVIDKVKVKTIIFTLFFLKVSIVSTFSQETAHQIDSIASKKVKSHLLSAYTGYSHHLVKSEAISPFIYSGTHPPIEINYLYTSAKNRQFISIHYNQLNLSNSSNPELEGGQNCKNYYGFLKYSYNLRIFRNQKAFECFIGGRLQIGANFRDYQYHQNTHEFELDQINSLGINLILEKSFSEKDLISINFNSPMLSYSLWNSVDAVDEWPYHNSWEFITLNRFMEIQTDILYTRFINKTFGFNLMYVMDYYTFPKYNHLVRLKYLNTQFLVGFTVKI